MKRFLGLSLLCIAVCAVSLSHNIQVKGMGPPDRVTVCHVQLSDTLSSGIMRFCGMVKSVPEPSLNAHLAHGDVEIESAAVEGTMCAFSVLLDGTVVPGLVD